MSNDPIRDIAAKSGMLGRINPESQAHLTDQQKRGHDPFIEDIVDIGFPQNRLDDLHKADTIEKILETIGFDKKREEAREEIYKYQKLPGEQVDQDYMYAAARAAMIDLMTYEPAPNTEQDLLRVFSTFLSQNMQRKELNPFNRPDTQGETKHEVRKTSNV